MILDLIRHADTGRAGYLDGRSDPALLPRAAALVDAACAGLQWPRVIASPLLRARDTALALAASRQLQRSLTIEATVTSCSSTKPFTAGTEPSKPLPKIGSTKAVPDSSAMSSK